MKKLLVVWIILAVIAVGGLTFLGFQITKQNEPYRKLEAELEKQANALVGAEPNLIYGGSKITIETLTEKGYPINQVVNDDYCYGYVIIEQNMNFYKYVPYIKCNKYKTVGYDKN